MYISKSQILLILFCVAIILMAGCTSKPPVSKQELLTNTSGDPISVINETEITWMSIPITDVITGRETSIIELASQGKPVIMHTFAVWCPACSVQLRETKKLMLNNPDSFIILGVDIDPRENGDQVRNHIEKNKFAGMFVSAPPDFSRSLMKTLGSQIIQSIPQTVIICNESVTYIGDGAFPEGKLRTILSQICS
ncbi:MAG TPA: redoxin family protein [Methanospirillum sp.]|nr:redoxin family protein [Methanospirillum sp.]